jgi:hypothetical protein
MRHGQTPEFGHTPENCFKQLAASEEGFRQPSFGRLHPQDRGQPMDYLPRALPTLPRGPNLHALPAHDREGATQDDITPPDALQQTTPEQPSRNAGSTESPLNPAPISTNQPLFSTQGPRNPPE